MLPDKETLALAELVSRRHERVRTRASEKTRGAGPGFLAALHTRSMEAITAEIDALDAEIAHRIATRPEWAVLDGCYQSVPGVGPTTSAVLLAPVPEMGKLDRRECAALLGLAPFAQESGTFRGQRRISGGRAIPRTALYMAATCAVRSEGNPFRPLFERIYQDGKRPYKKAVTAVMRKMAGALNAIARARVPFDAARVEDASPAKNEMAAGEIEVKRAANFIRKRGKS